MVRVARTRRMQAARCVAQRLGRRLPPEDTGCRTWPRRCEPRSPAWPGTPAATRRARLEMTTRSTSDGRRLLLQRLAKLARARLHLVEQAHVLDGDHRLVGEGRDEFDLLVGERPHRSFAPKSITPIGVPSRSSGTPKIVRKPPIFWPRPYVYSGSARTSGMMNDFALQATARPATVPLARFQVGDVATILGDIRR